MNEDILSDWGFLPPVDIYGDVYQLRRVEPVTKTVVREQMHNSAAGGKRLD